ncbi:hypothetical protein DRH29_04250 [candidate division Kazan bacterium]|uniref:Sodium/calcium exchanger membrane region domain-containing protein n=1 Tax=candidate division Kazan bacterium TaxID=2202143 RepID=A0A420ZBK9_UNCK3|nr:MAG: hypothetical protein DRH29_04250 [candidate division Kazan bacterium]
MLFAISVLIVTTLLIYMLSEFSESEGNVGYMYVVYPWITTAPETLTTVFLILEGRPVAGLFNSVFSAAFDLAVVGLAAIRFGSINMRSLVPLGVASALSALALVGVSYDGYLTFSDGVLLLTVLAVLMVFAATGYGISFGRFKYGGLWAALSMVAMVPAAWLLSKGVDMLCGYVPEYLAGVVSAVLTSLPDVIVALVYGLDTEEAIASIYGACAHDFVESIGLAALVAGLMGAAVPVPKPQHLAVVLTAIMMSWIFVMSYGRITRIEGAILVVSFAVLSYFAVVFGLL